MSPLKGLLMEILQILTKFLSRYGNTADYAAMIKDLVRRFPSTKVFWQQNISIFFFSRKILQFFYTQERGWQSKLRWSQLDSPWVATSSQRWLFLGLLSINGSKKSQKVNYQNVQQIYFFFILIITKKPYTWFDCYSAVICFPIK